MARQGASRELQVAEEGTHNTHGESAARRRMGGTNKRTRSRRTHPCTGTEREKDSCKWGGKGMGAAVVAMVTVVMVVMVVGVMILFFRGQFLVQSR